MATQEQLQRYLTAFLESWNASDKSKGAYGRSIVRAELVTNLRVRDKAGPNTIALSQIPSYSSLTAPPQPAPAVPAKKVVRNNRNNLNRTAASDDKSYDKVEAARLSKLKTDYNTGVTDTKNTSTTDTAPLVVSAKGRKTTPVKATEIAPAETVEAQNIAKVNKTIKFGEDLKIAAEKLGRTASLKGMTELAKDAHAYFSKVLPELALKAIANDLVYQPTAYRNSKMKSFKGAPEMTFGTQAEAEFFKGQGGKHAKNAAQWVRQNLSPEAIAFMDNLSNFMERTPLSFTSATKWN
jgi:hypothetical protein